MKHHFTRIKLAAGVDEDVGKLEPSCPAGENVKWCGHMERSTAVPQKIKRRIAMWSSNTIPEYVPKITEISVSKRYLCICSVYAYPWYHYSWQPTHTQERQGVPFHYPSHWRPSVDPHILHKSVPNTNSSNSTSDSDSAKSFDSGKSGSYNFHENIPASIWKWKSYPLPLTSPHGTYISKAIQILSYRNRWH